MLAGDPHVDLSERIPVELGNFFNTGGITDDVDGFLELAAAMTSDESLMLEFQRGSREAFEELFARYREPLYGFFRRRLESRERAEDLTQETFLAVIRATSRYEPRALVRTYLYGIALKLVAAERRKQSRNSSLPLLETMPASGDAS